MKKCEQCSYGTNKKSEKKSPKKDDKKKPMPSKKTKGRAKVKLVMEEGYAGKLHSGSKSGPIVKNPKQMIAIALSESRKQKK